MKALKAIGRKVYSVWCTTWFVLPFIVTYPLFRLFIAKPSRLKHAHTINRIWSKLQLRMYLMPITIRGREHIDPKQLYVFAPNHSSYIDIPLIIAVMPGFLNFVGKKSLTKVPLWGKIYQALYIAVDRDSPVSRAKAYVSSKQSIEAGRSVVIFPEGKISPEAGRTMLPFKDGPFKLAIEKQVPLVPITMPYNHLFLPDVKGKLVIRYHPLEMTIHPPISTQGMTLVDLEALKQKTFDIIQAELDAHQPHEYQHRNPAPVGALSPARV
ncbi:lysophospholipid acyltransferase family protein [Rufibacter ruber]|uniref:lysophospholipid acyltransferase family protein n=1 Tax=Rufibacter ruber TaxID=1783499 RepID=UPI00082C378C|nr:lysophospholipid acyltransferase family protein [Rufibacter ruber]